MGCFSQPTLSPCCGALRAESCLPQGDEAENTGEEEIHEEHRMLFNIFKQPRYVKQTT